ncbi:unnamed protein product [Porites evermanni]|uniref:Uncharacterized protein n=1 Tax=Porites evermanni TaxID=104178 RepID=A0ABN8MGY7_9CNID|nr:unnamed protein product [Porites evermanni]
MPPVLKLNLAHRNKKINELINSNQAKTTKLDEELTKLKNNLTLKDKAIAGLEDDNYRLSQEVDDLEQYTRRTNVRIYGVAEVGLLLSLLELQLKNLLYSSRVAHSFFRPRLGSGYIVRFTKHNSKVAVMSRRRGLKER